MDSGPRSERTEVKRKPSRGVYDLEQVHKILDEALTCTVGFVEGDQPYVVPTVHARAGDELFFHGSPTNRTLNALADGSPCCVTAALVDGVVLGRTAQKHSLNYRAAMVLGVARQVIETEEKIAALMAIIEHMVPGRTSDIARPDESELKSTMVMALPIDEASAKVRTGDPSDPPASLELPVWAGQLPLRLIAQEPLPDPALPPGATPPDYLLDWRKGA